MSPTHYNYRCASCGLAEVFSLHNYSITARATASGLALFTGRATTAADATAPRKNEEVQP